MCPGVLSDVWFVIILLIGLMSRPDLVGRILAASVLVVVWPILLIGQPGVFMSL